MIIDAHTYVHEKGVGGPFNLPCSADDLVRNMDEHNVSWSVVLPLPGVASNEFVWQECQRFSDRLVALYTPDFDDPRTTISKMASHFGFIDAHGIKIHPRRQNISISDTVVREVLCFANERNMPVLFDAFPFGPEFADPNQHPSAYCRLAQELPALQIVLAHAGGYRVLEGFLAAKACSNIALDVSFTPMYFRGTSVEKDLAFVCQRLSPGRVVYGSDFPEYDLGDFLMSTKSLVKELDEEKRRAFYGEAAIRIYSIGRRP